LNKGSAQIKAQLKYRYPYQARHTFATKHLSKGFNPLWVANQMGTSPEMIYKHYAVYLQKAWTPTGRVASKRVRKELENQKVS
jgi:integrase